MEQSIKLFCLPYAGGMFRMYHELSRLLPEWIQVISIEYAGHGIRRQEPYYQSFQEMVEDVAKVINSQSEPTDRIAIMGYSMGTLVAYELIAQKLLEKNIQFLILASHEPPDYVQNLEWKEDMGEEIFFEHIQSIGGFEKYKKEVLKNELFRGLYFEPLLNDYKLLKDYNMSRKIQIDSPALIFYSIHDIAEENIYRWNDFIRMNLEIVEVGENHFFIRNHAGEIAERIIEFVCDVDCGKNI